MARYGSTVAVRFAAPMVNVVGPPGPAPMPAAPALMTKTLPSAGRELDYLAKMKAMRTAGGEGPLMTVAPFERPQVPMTSMPVATMPTVAPIAPSKVIPSGPIVSTAPISPVVAPDMERIHLPARDVRQRASFPVPQMTAPTFQGVSRAEFDAHVAANADAFAKIANAIGGIQDQISRLAEQVSQLNVGVGQAMGTATAVGDSLQTLATNASMTMTKISDQVDAQNQALIALARGTTETFTPRRIVVPKVPPSHQQMPTTVDTSGRPVGVDETLRANQGTPASNVAGFRRWR